MKLLSYLHAGKPGWGLVDGDKVVDLSPVADSLKSAIAGELISRLEHLVKEPLAHLPLSELTSMPPIPEPTRILCVGQNYVAHREEMQGDNTACPLIFSRFPSSLVGHRQAVIKPGESEQFDFEGELAVIIGKRGRRIEKQDALQYIAGYSCFMDGSIRDYQNHTTQYLPGKNFEKSGAFGPWMIPANAIPDPNAGLSLRTRLNDELVQETTTDLMIFDVPTIISYLSTFTTLEAGDVIATGTPGGVGYKRKPQLFMKPGDKIEVEVESVGTLKNPVHNDPGN